MNKHINRTFRTYRDVCGLDKNNTVKLAERDHMPSEVATELLMVPAGKGRTTNRERKTYFAARQKSYESVFAPLAIEEVLARKMKKATWTQLCKWNERAICRRADVQALYLLTQRRKSQLQKHEVDPKNEKALAQVQLKLLYLDSEIAKLELSAAQLDLFWSAVDDEILARKKKVSASQAKV